MEFRKFLGGGSKSEESKEDIDIEDYLNDLSIREGKFIENEDLTYIKPIELSPEGKGIGNVLKEIEKENIVVLNVKSLLGNKIALHDVVKELRKACVDLDGDIGRISEEKILVVPKGMRIVHSEQAQLSRN
ncbi:MAG: cell division protein SepF [Candidatus Altiarchaeota archaeon]